MNTTIKEQYSLQPELRDALTRLSKTSKEVVTDMQIVSEAMTPFKTFAQVSTSASGFFKGIDWMNFYKNSFHPDAYIQILESLSEIQQAALKRMTDGQKEMLETFTNDSQNLFKATVNADKPQQALATYIDKSLDTYDDLKEKMQDQTSTMSSINSAYMAWMQQTIQSLSQSHAPKK